MIRRSLFQAAIAGVVAAFVPSVALAAPKPALETGTPMLLDSLRIQLRDHKAQLWSDAELQECLQIASDVIVVTIRDTFVSAEDLVAKYPTVRAVVLSGSMLMALQMLRLFQGVQIPLEKAERYEAMRSFVRKEFHQSLERFAETRETIRSLRAGVA